MKTCFSLVSLFLFGWYGSVVAEIGPSFSLEDSAWRATDILVVTEGPTIDGNLRVLEVWKGSLKVNTDVSIPELASFADETARVVSVRYQEMNTSAATVVTGSRMILFLKQPVEPLGRWRPANFFNDMTVSVLWIEQGRAYAFGQVINPGPTILVPTHWNEGAIKEETLGIIRTQNAIAEAVKDDNLTRRANSLEPFAQSKMWNARKLAFAELPKCGTNALPVLRAMLSNQDLAAQHSDVIEALGAAGGIAVGPELTTLVQSEFLFWKQTAPELPMGWWNGAGLNWTNVEELRNHYGKLLSAVCVLGTIRYSGCKDAVTNVRDLWRSLPQLGDKTGINQMSEQCDSVLQQIH
jgi:hypothetical protein